MARKAKKKPARITRPLTAAGPAAVATPPRPAGAGAVGATQAVRSLEMNLAPKAQQRGPRGRIVLETAEPGIPHHLVPHFGSDLRRLGVVGGAMLVLLGVGSRLIPLIVK